MNENESYEEEEIDVFEHEYVDTSIASTKSVEIVSLKAAGNPIALVFISLFAIFVTSRYRF